MNNIIDPVTNQKFSIFSSEGKNLLKNFVKLCTLYGSGDNDGKNDNDTDIVIIMIIVH